MFKLHEQLAADCVLVGKFPLSQLLLMNDARFPWCVLVPERENITEIHELSPEDRISLIEEIALVSEGLSRVFHARKINVGSLGNIVGQLHVHVVARRENDECWPNPVWGHYPPVEYNKAEIEQFRAMLSRELCEGAPGG